jgi:hypothetical protein
VNRNRELAEWRRHQERWIDAILVAPLTHGERLTLVALGRCTWRPGLVSCSQVDLARKVRAFTAHGEPNDKLIAKHLKAGRRFLKVVEPGGRKRQTVYALVLPETPSGERG